MTDVHHVIGGAPGLAEGQDKVARTVEKGRAAQRACEQDKSADDCAEYAEEFWNSFGFHFWVWFLRSIVVLLAMVRSSWARTRVAAA